MKHLEDGERERLVASIYAEAALLGVSFESSPWLDQLVVKVARRSPRHAGELARRQAS